MKTYENSKNLGQAIIDGDPEIDMEIIGRRLNKTHKLYLRQSGEIAYRVNMLQVIYDPSGNEKERRELTKALSNITGDSYVQWSGRKFPKNEVIRKFVFSKKYQLRHTDGATFDYLFAMAKELDELRGGVEQVKKGADIKIDTIAYPFGSEYDYSDRVIDKARELGYRLGFTLTERRNPEVLDPMRIDRICVCNDLSLASFRALISGIRNN
jgi:peptidoglycan/xylan/chitin deacetylase (PgdA/CDA1 family)